METLIEIPAKEVYLASLVFFGLAALCAGGVFWYYLGGWISVFFDEKKNK